MKYYLKVAFTALIGLALFSCTTDENKFPNDELGFNESVAIIEPAFSSYLYNKVDEELMIIELKNFNPHFKLSTQYKIKGVKYTDDGMFEDKIAGDGIYTAINKITLKKMKSFTESKLNFGPEFKFTENLKEYLDENYSIGELENTRNQKLKGSIGFGCKVRLITCPETGFWDTCWPISSPCTCVDFYDCEIGFKITFD
tara:strand:- start:301 stop:897 length:597 start_codon:yes stop_codon:yes gene_type:complete